MSRWLQRLSSKSRVIDGRISPKRQVQAEFNNGRCTAFTPSTIQQSRHSSNRETELSQRSYQLLVWKLRLLEEETSLTQQYESLIRRQDQSPESNDFEKELNAMLAKWDEIRVNKTRLGEEHEQLETAIEEHIADQERSRVWNHRQFYDTGV